MPCTLCAPDYSCVSLSRFILQTVSFNCLLNEGKSSLIRGLLHLGFESVRLLPQTDRDGSRRGYGYEPKSFPRRKNLRIKEMQT